MPMLNNIHAYLGLTLVLPLFVWAVTGLVFLFRPGYQEAYEQLSLVQGGYSTPIEVTPQPNWQQLRFVHTVLGGHLLVSTTAGEILHLDQATLTPRPYPSASQLEQLVSAATDHNPQRYGDLVAVEQERDRFRITTTTDVELELDWQSLTLQQRGDDTRFLDRLYRMHYLQWSPAPKLNKLLITVALLGLLAMCYVGLRMLIRFHHKESP